MIRKISLTIFAALVAMLMSTVVLAAPDDPYDQSYHKIVTVSGGDVIAVEGDDSCRDRTSHAPINPGNMTDGLNTVSSSEAVFGTKDFGYIYPFDDYGQSEGAYNYDYYEYSDNGLRSGGFSGMLLLVSAGIGAVVALTYYFSTKSSYENAGIGAVYDLKDNALLNIGNGGRIDRQIDTRSSVDRGFYARGSASAPQSGVDLSAPRQHLPEPRHHV